ncbi:MAG TPA: hypothetical protein VH370_08405 [Humisphaera sp.]|jgi:hypothetical protein|nr:hypothetical protein [Humisphaera sp.]
MKARKLYLCGGMQSSGSTLVSWCFLQRPDMDGVLDAAFDTLPQIPEQGPGQHAWCKFTIACFGFEDVKQHLEDEGWQITPLLIARDPRAVFNSLIRKRYGRNGITADDPPLRLRLRRFHRDWQLFRERGWPILRYESLTPDPIATLRTTCAMLQLPWDDAMVHWPKPPDAIPGKGNETFVHTRGAGLRDSIQPAMAQVKTDHIPPADLEWMEQEFADMNADLGYAAHIPSQAAADVPARAVPNIDCTRRYRAASRALRHQRRKRWLALVVIAATALIILADVMDWIKVIDFF